MRCVDMRTKRYKKKEISVLQYCIISILYLIIAGCAFVMEVLLERKTSVAIDHVLAGTKLTTSSIFELLICFIVIGFMVIFSGRIRSKLSTGLHKLFLIDLFSISLKNNSNEISGEKKYEATKNAAQAKRDIWFLVLGSVLVLGQIFLTIWLLFKINLSSTLILMLLLIIAYLLNTLSGKHINSLVAVRENNLRESSSYYGSCIRMLTTIHVYGLINDCKAKFSQLIGQWNSSYKNALGYQLVFGLIPSLISISAIGISLIMASHYTKLGYISHSDYLFYILLIIPLDDFIQELLANIIDIRISLSVYRSNCHELEINN